MSLSIEPCEEGFQHHQSLLRDNNSFKDKVQQLPEIDFLHKSYTDTQSAALSLFGEGKKKKNTFQLLQFQTLHLEFPGELILYCKVNFLLPFPSSKLQFQFVTKVCLEWLLVCSFYYDCKFVKTSKTSQ